MGALLVAVALVRPVLLQPRIPPAPVLTSSPTLSRHAPPPRHLSEDVTWTRSLGQTVRELLDQGASTYLRALSAGPDPTRAARSCSPSCGR
jgi:hypothetical protein